MNVQHREPQHLKHTSKKKNKNRRVSSIPIGIIIATKNFYIFFIYLFIYFLKIWSTLTLKFCNPVPGMKDALENNGYYAV